MNAKLSYYGAFRVSETLDVTPDRLLEENNRTYLKIESQKTDKTHWDLQPIHRVIYDELMLYSKLRNMKGNDPFFVGYKKTIYTRQAIYYALNRYAKDLNINKRIGTHTSRRSRATHLLNHGVDLAKVSHFLRHDSIITTMIYLKISKENLYDIMEKADSTSIIITEEMKSFAEI